MSKTPHLKADMRADELVTHIGQVLYSRRLQLGFRNYCALAEMPIVVVSSRRTFLESAEPRWTDEPEEKSEGGQRTAGAERRRALTLTVPAL